MEDKSIDQLRLEAQELYQAKLRAYNETKNGGSKAPAKAKVAENVIKPPTLKSEYIPKPEYVPTYVEEPPIAPKPKAQKTSGQKNNWFVVSIFTLLLIIVVMELFIFKS